MPFPAFSKCPRIGLFEPWGLRLTEPELHRRRIRRFSAVFRWTTVQGPASMTVTGIDLPLASKTWVIPSFFSQLFRSSSLPLLPSSVLRPSRPGQQLDLDVDAGGQIELHQRVDRLRRRLEDVEQPLVRPDLELLPRLLVDVRASAVR